jgi:hypothetical protein
MKSGFVLPLFILVLTDCQSPRSEESTHNTDTLAMVDLETPTTTPAETNNMAAPVVLSEMPMEVQAFMKALKNTDSLMKYVNPGSTYIIEEGPGVYPVVTEARTVEDLLANDALIQFMNTNYPAKSYYINQPVDRCNPPAEGIYFTKAEEDNLLLSSYESSLAATEAMLTEERRSALTKLDRARIWQGTIHISDQVDDFITFHVHLAQIDDWIFLVALDTRGCGA